MNRDVMKKYKIKNGSTEMKDLNAKIRHKKAKKEKKF
jgi:hypothetical protein